MFWQQMQRVLRFYRVTLEEIKYDGVRVTFLLLLFSKIKDLKAFELLLQSIMTLADLV
jgi:hypothetical protein